MTMAFVCENKLKFLRMGKINGGEHSQNEGLRTSQ
jgi:hypothetical protein